MPDFPSDSIRPSTNRYRTSPLSAGSSSAAVAHTDPGDHLIHVSDLREAGGDPRTLRVALRQGHLVRIRRGTYFPAGIWARLDGRARHALLVRAVVRDAVSPEFLVAGLSAAVFWGLPYAAEWPSPVQLSSPFLGGGKSEPGVSRSASGWDPDAGTMLRGVPLTNLARTALDVARSQPFPLAVATVDAAVAQRRPDAVPVEQLWEELSRAGFARQRRHLLRVVEFASPLSDSAGESTTRAVIHELGFEAPELQARFVDDKGEMFGDFAWRRAGVVAEFDGKVKYTRDEFTAGDPGEVLWREKQREDRLRRQVRRVVRIVWADVVDAPRLRRLLLEAGVPLRRVRVRAELAR